MKQPFVTFEAWVRLVDRILMRHYGITTSDLADAPYADNYEAGLTAREMAFEALENDDIGQMMLAEKPFELA